MFWIGLAAWLGPVQDISFGTARTTVTQIARYLSSMSAICPPKPALTQDDRRASSQPARHERRAGNQESTREMPANNPLLGTNG